MMAIFLLYLYHYGPTFVFLLIICFNLMSSLISNYNFLRLLKWSCGGDFGATFKFLCCGLAVVGSSHGNWAALN